MEVNNLLFDCYHLTRHLKLNPIINRYWIFQFNQLFSYLSCRCRGPLFPLKANNCIIRRKSHFSSAQVPYNFFVPEKALLFILHS